MPIGLPLQFYLSSAVSTARQDEIKKVDLNAANYGSHAEVAAAAAAILQLEAVRSFVGWGCRELSEGEAVMAIAYTALCEKAIAWQRNNPEQRSVESLSGENRREARAHFLSLLSSRGMAVLMGQDNPGRYEDVPGGVRFIPDTGSPEVDDLLAEVLSHEEAAARLKERSGLGSLTGIEAPVRPRNQADGLHCEKAGPSEGLEALKAAAAATSVGPTVQTAGGGRAEAEFWEGAAAYWEEANGPGHEAVAWGRAAKAWQAVGEIERAAEACEQEAAAREREAWNAHGAAQVAADVWSQAAEAWEGAATTWHAAGKPEYANLALEMEAQAWKASGQPDRAAEAWARAATGLQAAGELVRAEVALKQEAAARKAVEGSQLDSQA